MHTSLRSLVLIFLALSTLTLVTPNAKAAETPGVAEVEHPEAFSQVLALSDVHGMYDPLVQLLSHAKVIDDKKHWKAGKTLLIVVGDSIDKGPKSIDVLDLWMALTQEAQAAGGRVIHLLGNHEAEFLAYGKKGSKAEELLAELKEKGIRVKELRESDTPRGKFLHAMPVAAKVGRWIFCHAGLFPKMKWSEFATRSSALLKSDSYEDELFVGEDSILEAKDWWIKHKHRQALEDQLEADGIYGVVQGHQPKAYGIKNHIGATDEGRLIKLDNGMAPVAGSHPGALLLIASPAEMNLKKTPKLQIINTDGKTEALVIE